MDHIPGEYPSTPDEQPVSLTQRLRHPLAALGVGQSEPHEHNKLQKPQDPRSHKHVDSGVGIGEGEPALGSTQRMSEYKPVELAADREVSTSPSQNTAAGGLDAVFSQHRPPVNEPLAPISESRAPVNEPLAPISESRAPANEPLAPISESRAPANESHATSNEPRTTASSSSPHDAASFVPAPHRASNDGSPDNVHRDHTASKDTATPYWGDLPKAMSGGIYNTVMGHGSPKEDHTQHQNLPHKSTSPERTQVAGDAFGIPKGGVYNTVAGHGSREEETMRHNAPAGSFSENNQTTALGREQPAGDRQQPVGSSGLTSLGREHPAGGREQLVGSSGLAAAAFPVPQRHSQQPESLGTSSSTATGAPQQTFASSGHAASAVPDAARTTDQAHSTSPRAFPLGSSHQDTRHQSAGDSHQDTHRQSADDSHTRRDYIAPAAIAGAGLAAAQQADKPKKLQKPRGDSPDEEPRRRSMDPAHGIATHTEGTARSSSRRASSSNRRAARGSESNSPASTERKKHGILGLFHRHKDDKEEKKTVTKEPKADSHHDHHHKQEAAVAGATGAGVYGLTKHHNDEKKDRHNSEPMAAREDPHAPAKHLSANDHPTSHAQPSAAFGTLPPTIDENVARRSGNDVPAPPARSEKRRSGSPTAMAAMTAGPAHQSHESSRDLQPQASRQSHDNVSRFAPGVAAGLGASVLAAGHDRSSVSPAQDPTSPVTFEHPRAPPSTPFDSKLAAGSKHVRSGSSSSPKATTMVGDNTVTNAPGEYNTLPSGTASGVHSSIPHNTSSGTQARTHTPPHSNPTAGSSDEPAYNVLPSGTPSGVKIGHRSSHSTGSATGPSDRSTGLSDRTNDDSHHRGLATGAAAGMAATGLAANQAHKHHSPERDAEYNTLSSGTASGVNPAHAHAHLDEAKADAPSVLHQDNHQSRPTGFNMPPMPMHSSNHPLPTVPDESKPNPTPEQAKNMSPEVMPDAYTATTRSSEHHHSEPRHSEPRHEQRQPEQRHPALHHSAANPALAAAAGAWAASAGPSSGNTTGAGHGGPGKVTHKCGHCGGEEDISAEVKEAVRKVLQAAKMKRGGKEAEMGGEENWWHDAWTSM